MEGGYRINRSFFDFAQFAKCANSRSTALRVRMTLLLVGLDSGRTGNCKGKNKCGGLSTTQQTMKLSVSPVEMTQFLVTVTDLLSGWLF